MIPNTQVMLRPVDPFAHGGDQAAMVQADGSFSITNCDAASYAVRFTAPTGTYVKSIMFNQQDATTHPIDLSRGAGGELAIVVRPGAASVTATVQESNEPGAPLDVVLIPDLWTENGLMPVLHATSKDGKFSFNGIPPGHYTAVAARGVEADLWRNAAFVRAMRERGASIELAENDQKIVSTPEVTGGEIDRIELQLGLY